MKKIHIPSSPFMEENHCSALISTKARVLPPVETAGLGPGDVTALRERVRDAIAAARMELRERLDAEG
ncbi:MAG: hypothetical protein P8177_06230 [Gemmatimonadota bacterium]